MKILYLANARIPTEKAHGVAIVKMAEAMAKSGALLRLVLPKRQAGKESLITEDLFNYYGIKRNFTVKRLFCFDWRFLHQIGWGKLAYLIRTPIFLLELVFIILFNLNSVIYSRDGVIAGLASLFHKKVFFEIHRLPKEQSKNFYNRVFKRVAGIVAISRQERLDLIKEYDLPESKIISEPSAVNLDDFILPDKGAMRQKHNIPLASIVFAYIGKFSIIGHGKDVGGLLSCFRKALAKNDKLFLLLGGLKEEDLKIIRPLVNQEGLAEKVALLPHVPFNQVKEYYALSDIFVLLYSAEVLEKFSLSPMKLFEYAACERPIICPDAPGTREIFNEDEVVFYQTGDYNDLGEKMLKLAENIQFRLLIAGHAYERVKAFNWADRAARILNFVNLKTGI